MVVGQTFSKMVIIWLTLVRIMQEEYIYHILSVSIMWVNTNMEIQTDMGNTYGIMETSMLENL